VILLDMMPLQARFATQDQAESAMRKLASLRSDRFRLERVGAYADTGTPEIDASQPVDGLTASVLAGSAFPSSGGVMASGVAAAVQWGVTPEGGPSEEYTLSANVPGEATEQARNVILQAGGQMM
jgi:hypothetical protein